MPLPNASEAQKIIASDAFREWYEDGWSVVLVKASEQGVDLTAHKDVWRKARECTAVPSEQDSMPETHEAAPDRDASRQSNVSRKLKQRVQSMTVLSSVHAFLRRCHCVGVNKCMAGITVEP